LGHHIVVTIACIRSKKWHSLSHFKCAYTCSDCFNNAVSFWRTRCYLTNSRKGNRYHVNVWVNAQIFSIATANVSHQWADWNLVDEVDDTWPRTVSGATEVRCYCLIDLHTTDILSLHSTHIFINPFITCNRGQIRSWGRRHHMSWTAHRIVQFKCDRVNDNI